MPPKKLLFGTAGIPESTKGNNSISGIERVRELNLDCMELEFVQGIRMSEKGARNVMEAANKEKNSTECPCTLLYQPEFFRRRKTQGKHGEDLPGRQDR
jgi:endonuclease IV